MRPRVCAIIACYTGDRRWSSPSFKVDRLHYAKVNLTRIKAHATLIEDIYLVFNGGLTDGIAVLCQPNVTMVARDNIGFSYGAWDHALKMVMDTYDFAYLSEDDYAPTMDGFDERLVEYLKGGRVGYVAGLLGENRHAAVANGMISLQGFREVHQRHGGLTIVPGQDYGSAEGSQMAFPLSLQDFGYELVDTTDRYKTLFNDLHGATKSIITFGDPSKPHLFEPITD